MKQPLNQLISILVKSEKRFITLQFSQATKANNSIIKKLYTVMQNQPNLSNSELSNALKIDDVALRNAKYYLQKNLIKWLVALHQDKNNRSFIHRGLIAAKILFERGLNTLAFDELDAVKQEAKVQEKFSYLLEAINLEEQLLLQNMNLNLKKKRIHAVYAQKRELVDKIVELNNMQEANFKVHAALLKIGHTRHEKELTEVNELMKNELLDPEFKCLSISSSILYNEAHNAYANVLANPIKEMAHAKKLLDLYSDNPRFAAQHFERHSHAYYRYIIGLVNHCQFKLCNLYVIDYKKMKANYANKHSETLHFAKKAIAEMNYYLYTGKFKQGMEIALNIEDQWRNDKIKVPIYYEMILQINFACLHFGGENYKYACKKLSDVVHTNKYTVREDLITIAHLMYVMALFEMKQTDRLKIQMQLSYRFLMRKKKLEKLELLIIKFIKVGLKSEISWDALYEQLKELIPQEKEQFEFFIIENWVKGHIFKTSFAQEVKLRAERLDGKVLQI